MVAVLAGLASAVVSYLVAVRRLSGRIETTEAKELWEEAASIRRWSTERITELMGEVRTLEARIRELEEENLRLRLERGGFAS